MAKLTLYHGSDHIVDSPEFGIGNPHNDYGQGFYCTKSLDMAFEWAVGHGCDGYANEYGLDDEGLVTVDFDSADFCALHWLTVLLQNRTFELRSPLALEAHQYLIQYFSVDLSNADLVTGCRADDSYFTFAQDFIMGVISYRQLKNALHLGNLGRQTMIKSPRAFDHLSFVGSKVASRVVWLPHREERDRLARRRYFDVERHKRRKGDIFIMQILDEEVRPGDERL